MSIELRVPARQQDSPMSCWWASIAMVLEYYGQRYSHPWEYRSEFRRPWSAPRTGFPVSSSPSILQAMAHDSTLRRTHELVTTQPYEWYEHGVPPNPTAMHRLLDISGFERVNPLPATGSWSLPDIEALVRANGPLVFFGMWNGAPHAVVVTGVHTRRNHVVYIDPARGFAISVPLLQFNQLMMRFPMRSQREMQGASLNPFHYPVSNPVRGTIVVN